ncbi:Uncharacterised protein [uncultured archaeon]|nr:Uncharacterised protein [uncultured archaeon]
MADLRIREELLEDIVCALQVGALLYENPSYSVDFNPGLNYRKDGLVFCSIGYNHYTFGLEARDQLL